MTRLGKGTGGVLKSALNGFRWVFHSVKVVGLRQCFIPTSLTAGHIEQGRV